MKRTLKELFRDAADTFGDFALGMLGTFVVGGIILLIVFLPRCM
jgi:hypothetical protein